MKKVLILSYYFSPANLTPSERVSSFAQGLKENGYEPIVVTRDWSHNVKKMGDAFLSSGSTIKEENNLGYKVYYVPYQSNLAQRMFKKFSGTKLYPLYLVMSFLYKIVENYTSFFTNLIPLYKQCEAILQKDKIDLILISGAPFHLFKFGYKLNQKYKVPWIADYRDDWNTNELETKNKIKSLVRFACKGSERKWLSNASLFLSVSDYYVNKIEKLIHKKGYTIENGYKKENYKSLPKPKNNPLFTISYVGSLYKSQPIEVFLEGLKQFIDRTNVPKIKIQFIGLASQKEAQLRVAKYIKAYEPYFEMTERISKAEAIQMQLNSNLLLMCAHHGLKGTPGSKLYEYLVFAKPVLVCPSDNDIIESTLRATGQGLITNNTQEVFKTLNEIYAIWLIGNDSNTSLSIDSQAIESFTRKNLCKKLILLLEKEGLL